MKQHRIKLTICILLLLRQVYSCAVHKEYEQMIGLSNDQLKTKYLGLTFKHKSVMKYLTNKQPLSLLLSDSEPTFPESFDSRIKWASCINPIRNQQHCGSCWAFAGSEVLSDRLCILSQGQQKAILSPQYMVSCDMNDHGCQGGELDQEWTFLAETGVVTEECIPYESGQGVVPICMDRCIDGTLISDANKVRVQSESISILTSVQQIKGEIMLNGPVETGFQVYKDFMSYRSGVYKQTSDQMIGGHAVKIVGWGQENGDEYWICANSWSEKWGEDGYFRIKQGECHIDHAAIAGLPILNKTVII